MRLVLLIVLLICAIDAFAATSNDDVSLEVPPAKPQPHLRKRIPPHLRMEAAPAIAAFFERSKTAQNYESRTLLALRAGAEYGQHEFLVEVGGFKQQTGTSGVDVSRFHQQVDLWYHFLFLRDEVIGHPYLGGGLGAQRDVVTTTFFNSSAEDTGEFESQFSVAGGYRWDAAEALSVWLEARLTTSANYEPKVIPSALLAVGFRTK